MHILKVPFVLTYTPPPTREVLGMTFAWTPDYASRIQRGFESEEHIKQLEEALQKANETIAELRDGDKNGSKRL